MVQVTGRFDDRLILKWVLIVLQFYAVYRYICFQGRIEFHLLAEHINDIPFKTH